MSRQFNNKKSNNTANNVNSRKPFCKVCADAGKTDTAHFPRKTADPNSEVVCPTLLSLECRYCFKNGHTVKYCTVLKERNARDEQDRREHERHQRHLERQMEQERQARAPVVEKKANGKFAVFLDEDEEEERRERDEEEMRLKGFWSIGEDGNGAPTGGYGGNGGGDGGQRDGYLHTRQPA